MTLNHLPVGDSTEILLEAVHKSVQALEARLAGKLEVNADLTRTLVSFQANKQEPQYRWFKYKEGFSATLLHYILDALKIARGRVLDPFAGVGTTLFVASQRGLDATGIELLPIGCEVIELRREILNGGRARAEQLVKRWREGRLWKNAAPRPFPHLKITDGAFPPDTETSLGRYLSAVEDEGDQTARRLLRLAAHAVLEEISYTRKDGQYLRWDYRSGRRQGTRPFNKGHIKAFDTAIEHKLSEMYADLGARNGLFDVCPNTDELGNIEVLKGSCLKILPTLDSASFDCLITSPPYCNRYDYTRTYALELALLGVDEEELRSLRQEMMSCTVENRDKHGLEAIFSPGIYGRAVAAFQEQEELQTIVRYLEQRRDSKQINNSGIPRMVRNYFLEMSMVLFECARVLRPVPRSLW